MSSKSRKHKDQIIKTQKAVELTLTITVWAFVSIVKPSAEDVKKVAAEVRNLFDSVKTGNLNLAAIRQALHDEYGWEVE